MEEEEEEVIGALTRSDISFSLSVGVLTESISIPRAAPITNPLKS